MSIFDNRSLNAEEQQILKNILNDKIEVYQQLRDLQEHDKEITKDCCDRLNEKIEDKSLWIKPKLLNKMAKTKMKEDMAFQKDELSDVEIGLELINKA